MRLILILLLCPAIVFANNPDWKLVGTGEMHKLLWHVYDTKLTTANGAYDPSKPYQLENTYHMDFTAKELAERSIGEMRRHGTFSDAQARRWQSELVALWPDVQEGDRIAAKAVPGKKVVFYHNGTELGAISDAIFVELFMAIWLGENTSEPELRAALLGTRSH
jgi:hypothetical protein